MAHPELEAKNSPPPAPERKFWLVPKRPLNGAFFFRRAALLTLICAGVDWLSRRRDAPPPDGMILIVSGIVGALLLIGLAFELWERRLRHQLQARAIARAKLVETATRVPPSGL